MIDENKSIKEVEKLLMGESNFHIETTTQFDKGINHIFQLISDSYILYTHNAYPSSVFLSIAIIEEVAKLHMGIFTKLSNEHKKKDKLRDHKTKEVIGVNYTVSMSERIKTVMDADDLEEIYKMAYSGELKNLREKSIYCEYKDKELVIPSEVIDKKFSRNILLFAIESFDDNLVGYTNHSINVSKKTDVIFKNVAG
ncbi:MAG: AbiV family abortive infection protein [Ruminococcus sp.]|nr:AbiV family abortive infection protein [Ruminococcus sp.]